jgi:excisionase family DNA binding protein
MTTVPHHKRQVEAKEEDTLQTSETNMTRDWLTVQEMQRLLGIGSTKGYELIASGQIPCVRIGRSIRINRRRLEEWLDQQTSTPHS